MRGGFLWLQSFLHAVERDGLEPECLSSVKTGKVLSNFEPARIYRKNAKLAREFCSVRESFQTETRVRPLFLRLTPSTDLTRIACFYYQVFGGGLTENRFPLSTNEWATRWNCTRIAYLWPNVVSLRFRGDKCQVIKLTLRQARFAEPSWEERPFFSVTSIRSHRFTGVAFAQSGESFRISTAKKALHLRSAWLSLPVFPHSC